MATLDIRNLSSNERITEIKFTDEDATSYTAYQLEDYCSDEIRIVGSQSSLYLRKQDIPSIIAALQKAQEIW